MPTYTCLNCSNTAQHVCACCKKSVYCGKECLKSDWKIKHKYESFLFKAESGEVSNSEGEKMKRERIEKMKTEGDLLREEYQKVNRELEEARKKKKRSKKEMAMTHNERKRYEFNVLLFLKEMGMKSTDTKDREYVKEIEEMVEAMNDLPLRSGEPRNISIGPEDRVQLGHIIMRKRILNLKVALIIATDSQEVSNDATEYRVMSEDLERRFIFNLMNDESDEVSFDDMMRDKHEEIENELVSNWIEKAYEGSIAGASQKCIEFFDSIKQDLPNVKLSPEEHAKELDFVRQQLKTLRNCALQYTLATTDRQFNQGLITKEVHDNAVSYYQKISNKVDSLIDDDSDTIAEDMERVIRRHYGREEWSKIKSILNQFYMNEEEEEGEMGLGGKIFGFTVNRNYLGGVAWASFIVFFVSYFILSFIGIVSYMGSPVKAVDDIEREFNGLKSTLLSGQEKLVNDTELLISVGHEFEVLSNRTIAVNTTRFYDTARIPAKDLNDADRDILRTCVSSLLDALNKQIAEATQRLSTEPLLKETVEDLQAFRKVIEDYIGTAPDSFDALTILMGKIASKTWAWSGMLTKAGFVQTNEVLQLLIKQLKEVVQVANSKISNAKETYKVISDRSKIITDNINKLQEMRPQLRGSSMVSYLTTQWNPHGYTTTDKIVSLYNQNSTMDQVKFVFNEGFSGYSNTITYIGILIQDCYESLPQFDSSNFCASLAAITTALITGFLPAQNLFFTLLTATGVKVAAFAGGKVATVAAFAVGKISQGTRLRRWMSKLMDKCIAPVSLNELPSDRVLKLNKIVKDLDKIFQKSYENRFYTFFSFISEENLTIEEIALVWNRKDNTKNLTNRDMWFFRMGYNIKWLYYLGIRNVSDALSIGTVLYRYVLTAKFLINILDTVWEFSKSVIFYQPVVNFLYWYGLFFALRYAIWYGWESYSPTKDPPEGTPKPILTKRLLITAEKEAYIYVRDSRIPEYVSMPFNYVGPPLVEFVSNVGTKLLGVIYTGYRSYYSIISTMIYLFLLFVSFSQWMPNIVPNLDSMKELFLGWGKLPDKIKEVVNWNDAYEGNITSFKNLINDTETVKTSLGKYVENNIINGTTIVITDFLPQVQAYSANLSNIITTLPK